MLRLFTALPIPEDLRTRLTLMQGGIDGASWSPPDNLHITLTFIGAVSEDKAEDIHDILSSISMPAFDVQLKGIGVFAQGEKPKVLWLGVEADAALERLKNKIDTALRRGGIEVERRKYIPHLTLARLHHPDAAQLGEMLAGHNLFASDLWRVSDFTLYHSIESKHGYAYHPLTDYPLTQF